MRMKYGEGVVSDEFIKTGELKHKRKTRTDDREHIEKMLEINRKNTKKAIKNFRPWRAKRKGPEYKIVIE